MTTQLIHATQDTPTLRQIAAHLRQAAHDLPEDAPAHDTVTVILGSLRVTCHATGPALRQAADKYDKGFRRKGKRLTTSPTTTRSRFREQTFFGLLYEDGPDNALAYARLYPVADYTPRVVEWLTKHSYLLGQSA